MPNKEEPLDFRLLMARLEHQRRIISRYMKPEEWESLQEGDPVVIDNSDSLHDGERGSFIAHDWVVSGYVRLIVAFPDGKKCYYLPNQVVRVYDEPIEPDAVPVKTEEGTVTPEQSEPPPKKGIDFRKYDPERLEASAISFIESKLAQVAKMPVSTRKKILIGTMPPELVDTAVKLGIERGILPA